MAQPLASASTFASSSASSHGNYSYQIFINHRGVDVKKTFASHLYYRLLSDGFRVFLDQPELQRGEEIGSQIQEAIATASVRVAIFSPGYAQSSWCLDELVLMLESKEFRAATVIPVFYDVKPSDLRRMDKKKGYAEAFLNHEEKGRYSQERVAGWRRALHVVSNISGLVLEACNGDEGLLVDEVVRHVRKHVGKPPFHVATHPTGLKEKLQQLQRTVLCEQQHNRGGPNIVGIVGIGGLGKTTLAKFFFNHNRSRYQQSCFLHDVRDAAARGSLPSLQSQLYKDLNGGDEVMRNVEEGIAMLRYRLSSPQVLIVLDDVDDAEQLDALFSPLKDVLLSDSLILLTSRNREVLRKSARIEESSIYIMTPLNLQYSRRLFCSYAFAPPPAVEDEDLVDPYPAVEDEDLVDPYPAVEYEDLVGEFLKVCQGLPLTLKEIGALLNSESREYWEEQLRKFGTP